MARFFRCFRLDSRCFAGLVQNAVGSIVYLKVFDISVHIDQDKS